MYCLMKVTIYLKIYNEVDCEKKSTVIIYLPVPVAPYSEGGKRHTVAYDCSHIIINSID